MKRRRKGRGLVRLAVACQAALFAACGGSPAAPDGPVVVEPIQIDSVTVALAGSPAQASAHVTGVVGDGCARLLPVTQDRAGAAIHVEIQRQRPRDAVCIQIAQLYDETIRLAGEFPAGSYSLQVNSVTRTFVVP
jgi:hypothetical protein